MVRKTAISPKTERAGTGKIDARITPVILKLAGALLTRTLSEHTRAPTLHFPIHGQNRRPFLDPTAQEGGRGLLENSTVLAPPNMDPETPGRAQPRLAELFKNE